MPLLATAAARRQRKDLSCRPLLPRVAESAADMETLAGMERNLEGKEAGDGEGWGEKVGGGEEGGRGSGGGGGGGGAAPAAPASFFPFLPDNRLHPLLRNEMSPREQALLDYLAVACGAAWDDAIEAAVGIHHALLLN